MFVTALLIATAGGLGTVAGDRRCGRPPRWKLAAAVAFAAGAVGWLVCYLSVVYQTTDREYWTGYVAKVTYREGWTEIRVVVESDSKGRMTTRVVTENHPPEWHVLDTNEEWTGVGEATYLAVCRRLGVASPATGGWSGVRYAYAWSGQPETAYVWTTVHKFRNPTLAGSTLFSFRDLREAEVTELALPKWEDFQWRPASGGPPELAAALDRLNADLGRSHKVRVHIVFAPPQVGPEWGRSLEEYWKNGKKNELTLVVGAEGADHRVRWAHAFGWSRSDHVKVSLRDLVTGMDRFDASQVLTHLRRSIPEGWTVADFREFDYVRVRVPVWLSLVAAALAAATGVTVGRVVDSSDRHIKP